MKEITNTDKWKTALFNGWSDGTKETYMYKGKLYVPESCRAEVMKSCHDSPVVGHPGQWRTLELVQRSYYWPDMAAYIGKYVKGCDVCQCTKTLPAKPQGELQPTEIPSRPWQIISTDLITQLPDSQGFDSIFVVVDRFTKMIHAVPTTTEVTSEGVACLFRDNVWKLHGLPEKVILDRGPQSASKMMRELNRLLGIKTATSTAYHPQTDGQMEWTDGAYKPRDRTISLHICQP
jgi:hypothetical protein